MEINIENIKAAYNKADESGMKILRMLVPNLDEIISVKDRIKTLADACNALGRLHPLVENLANLNSCDKNLFAFVQLRIICAALNEGWVSKPGNVSYYPVFKFFTEAEVKEMGNKTAEALYIIEPKFDTDFVAVDYSFSAKSETDSSCLRLKVPDLARYCGTQFIAIWMNYLLPIKKDD